ncbi:type III-A CRISPR-associated protein Cas10/Csm1 [Geitlerinema sp. PCC 9228]|uniref:type III-A CRISPR-associated protein Cas10/Csm1 n=1 Tax=Geitlerinema sp. PCC 9228 TaxID=111611 RepID=UPI0008F9D003|nr:type III-A CRISPR-associated protein Cas10/Csm1 [Geitlerinema sp. PCC 9228]
MSNTKSAYKAALGVFQQAVRTLATWSGTNLPDGCEDVASLEAMEIAKELLSWQSEADNIGALRLLFDGIGSSNSESESIKPKRHYWQPQAIETVGEEFYPRIPYPLSYPTGSDPTDMDFEKLKQKIQEQIRNLNKYDWQNLALLTLFVEKFGSYIHLGEEDVAFTDITKSTAAIAATLAENPEAENIALVAGDLSGIQNFIYTISSDGALKSLRARSFYLELVTEEVVQQLLQNLELPRTNVVYAGGGNLYVLAPAGEDTQRKVAQVREQINHWLFDCFQGKVFLALDHLEFHRNNIQSKEFSEYWSAATKKLAKQKARKFENQLQTLLGKQTTYEPCRVCHRDDEPKLHPLRQEPDSPLACKTCREMFELGGDLLKVKAIVRSHRKDIRGSCHSIHFQLPATPSLNQEDIWYHLFDSDKPVVVESDTVLLVDNWNIDNYQFKLFKNPVPLLLGNYGKESEQEQSNFIRSEEMVEYAEGIPRVGYLRMDVDNLGTIFAQGLGEAQTLPRLTGLSRQMSYFFKVYLNSLAANRQENMPPNARKLTPSAKRENLLFIYAGGDDLFISGSWNEVVEFAFDIYQSFRSHTGYNPNISISGGISLAETKFPLYQAAEESGDAEEKAKGNGRDSLGMFGQVFKWDEWLGNRDRVLDAFLQNLENYFSREEFPQEEVPIGIFPTVDILRNQLEIGYARSFLRNLLATAQLQEKAIEDLEEKQKIYPEQDKDLRYYLHLPKVAYTLARLPQTMRDNPEFEKVRKALLSPYNAPYFRAIATWLELLNRSSDTTTGKEKEEELRS